MKNTNFLKAEKIIGCGIGKTFDDNVVLSNVNFVAHVEKPLAIMGSSGQGKTTLLRILAGLDDDFIGEIKVRSENTILPYSPKAVHPSFAFQENRFFEHLSLERNISIATGASLEAIRMFDQELLHKQELSTLCKNASGGQRRKGEIIRALLYPSSLVIMDEPFAFLDEKSRQMAYNLIRTHIKNRILIFSTHSKHDCRVMGADILNLKI